MPDLMIGYFVRYGQDNFLSHAEDITNRTEDIPFHTVDIPRHTDGFPNRIDDILFRTVDIPKQTDGFPSHADSIPDRIAIILRHTISIPCDTFLFQTTQDDIPDCKAHIPKLSDRIQLKIVHFHFNTDVVSYQMNLIPIHLKKKSAFINFYNEKLVRFSIIFCQEKNKISMLVYKAKYLL